MKDPEIIESESSRGAGRKRSWRRERSSGVLNSAGLCFRGIPVTLPTFQLPLLEMIDSVLGDMETSSARLCA